MQNPTVRGIVIALLVCLALAGGWRLGAQPARDRIIESAHISAGAGDVILTIELSLPFRYLSHIPLDKGEELRIRIRPVRVASPDRDAVFEREAVVPPDADTAAIDQVIYEGDAPDGPWLTVRFTRRVRYEVIPGGDYRSITVVIRELLQ